VNRSIKILILILFISLNLPAAGKKTISFKAKDGVTITADLYLAHDKSAPFILLCHQAGWSRGEYIEIAPKLNEMGFNCMAIDQRSGNEVNGIENLTHKNALELNKGTNYIDAIQDIDAAVKFAKSEYAKGKFIIWGSSYSAALVIKYTGDHPELIDGLLSFSPGEYFERDGKSNTYISESAKDVTCPVFITSAKNERENWQGIYDVIHSKNKTWFLPSTKGNHGSRALFKKFDDNPQYWKAVKGFLNKYFL